MKSVVLAAGMFLAACSNCNPTPPQPVSPAQYVYDSLVEAGCLEPDPVNGLTAVEQDLTTPGTPAWETCIADGGSPASCNAPCGDDSKTKRKKKK
jgi:hypothetical protein